MAKDAARYFARGAAPRSTPAEPPTTAIIGKVRVFHSETGCGHSTYSMEVTSHFKRIECQFQPLRDFGINASGYPSHAEVARAFRRYVVRRDREHDNARPSIQQMVVQPDRIQANCIHMPRHAADGVITGGCAGLGHRTEANNRADLHCAFGLMRSQR
ncbi:MAG: hypothetical protein JO020_32430 [Chloroflexi bacterium]|nr:hypothetical protein [Chloroflexota bacterium]MBV9898887.1 hypothetical protein [Chloroflexota bacterium]